MWVGRAGPRWLATSVTPAIALLPHAPCTMCLFVRVFPFRRSLRHAVPFLPSNARPARRSKPPKAAGVVSMPSRALGQFVAPHKVTFASSDPSAAAAFAARYLGATRLSGDDGKPAGSFRVKAACATGGTACGDCVVGEWAAFRHTRLNMHDVPRGFVKLGFDSFHLHFVRHSHRPTGNLSIAAFERAVAASHGDFDSWDTWMDFRLTLRGRSLDGLVAMWKTASRPEASANSPSSLGSPRPIGR